MLVTSKSTLQVSRNPWGVPDIRDSVKRTLQRLKMCDPNFINLDLSYKIINLKDIKCLVNAMKSSKVIKTLRLCTCGLDYKAAEQLKPWLSNKVLTDLYLSFNKIGSKGLGFLVEGLQGNHSLQALDLSNNEIKDVTCLVKALQEGQPLLWLDLSGNGINIEGVKGLAQVLSASSFLRELNLGGNDLDAVGAEAIGRALVDNRILKKLGLKLCGLGDQGAIAIARGLKGNVSVREVNLSENDIGYNGAEALAEMLGVNKVVTILDLDKNQMKDAGARSVSKALLTNTTLKSLRLGGNKISDDGVSNIARGMWNNNSLAALDLWCNLIGPEGAIRLAGMLRRNTTLTELSLLSNQLDEQGVESLCGAMESNHSVLYLELANNRMDSVFEERIEVPLLESLKRNLLSAREAFKAVGGDMLAFRNLLDQGGVSANARDMSFFGSGIFPRDLYLPSLYPHRGNSLLHAVVENGAGDLVQYLVSKGSANALPNVAGKTPLDVARSGNKRTLLDCLEMSPAPSLDEAERPPTENEQSPEKEKGVRRRAGHLQSHS